MSWWNLDKSKVMFDLTLMESIIKKSSEILNSFDFNENTKLPAQIKVQTNDNGRLYSKYNLN